MNTTTTNGTNETAPVEFLTRRELAQRWKCSTETVKRREASGMLRPVRLGARKLLYRLSDIETIEIGNGGNIHGSIINAGGMQ